MAGERQLTAEERRDAQRKLNEIREKLSTPGSRAAWQKVADVLNRASEEAKESTTGETLRKMGDLGDGGAKVERMIRRYLGEPGPGERTVEQVERYHTIALGFARARAAKVPEAVLDAARLTLGVDKGVDGPSLEEVERVIRDELAQVSRARRLYSAADIDAPPARSTTRVTEQGKKARTPEGAPMVRRPGRR
jgi:hypothetical protein